jgi:hypothetical protein
MSNELPEWMTEEEDQPGRVDPGSGDADGEVQIDQAAKASYRYNITTDDLNLLLGQFAGIRQVNAAELVSELESQPSLGGNRILLNDREQLHVATLEYLIESEGQQKPTSGKKIPTPVHSLRVFATITLFVAVLIPQLLPIHPGLFAQPNNSLQVMRAFQLVDSILPQSSVLLAVDVEPGYSGEMSTVATPILKHLLAKGTQVAIISTTPTGPAQAEILMTQSGYPQAMAGSSSSGYLNFGYLPGGQVGLQYLVQSPDEVLPNLGLRRNYAETLPNPELTLADFAMMIVVSDRPEVARSWIEQVRPALATTPVVFLLSAQAKPVIAPYLGENPGQIQGLVAGLADGYAYERLLQQSSNQAVNWISYNLGLVVAVILIAAAGAWRLVLSKNAKPAKDE